MAYKSKSIIRKNLILSLVFGLIMGLIFPVFASFFVTFNSSISLIIFSALCILAGVIVGVTAFSITKITIIKVIQEIDNQMNQFNFLLIKSSSEFLKLKIEKLISTEGNLLEFSQQMVQKKYTK